MKKIKSPNGGQDNLIFSWEESEQNTCTAVKIVVYFSLSVKAKIFFSLQATLETLAQHNLPNPNLSSTKTKLNLVSIYKVLKEKR